MSEYRKINGQLVKVNVETWKQLDAKVMKLLDVGKSDKEIIEYMIENGFMEKDARTELKRIKEAKK